MSDHSHSLETIFSDALQKGTELEMLAYVDEVDGASPELKSQVKQLIEAHCRTAKSFLESPPVEIESALSKDTPTMDVSPDALNAGFSAAFTENSAVVVGGAGHSVLRSLNQRTGASPNVTLNEDPEQRSKAHKPNSSEIPKTASDSRYQVHGELARGGMGAVLKGRDVDLGRDLAIKVLLDQHKERPELIERFVEEAQIGGQLQHPGIAPVYELGQFEDQRPFFTMKLVKGETLAAILAKRASAEHEIPKLIGIFEQICQTMAYAHSKGVIHRDLKPANIMVGAFGEVQVMDWGLSKVLETGGVADEQKPLDRDVSVIETKRSGGSSAAGIGSHTMDGSIMGTPAYMPPEQAHGEIDRLDAATDVFALGAVLAEILSGSPPYVAESGDEVFRLARRGKLDDCFERLDESHADPELTAICKKALSHEQVDRYHDASELSDAITAHVEGVQEQLKKSELARVEAETRTEEEKKRKRLYLGIVGLVGGALLLTLGLAAMLKDSRDRIERQADQLVVEKQQAVEARALEREARIQAQEAEQSETRENLRLRLLRLADKSRELRESWRELSILLAVEAINIAKANELWPLPDAHAALLEATIDVSGTRTPWRSWVHFTQAKNRAVSYSHDETRLVFWAFGENGVQPTGLQIDTNFDVEDFYFNEDGTRFTTVSNSGNLVLWTTNNELTAIAGQPRELEGVGPRALSLDASLLIGESEDQLFLWRDPFESEISREDGVPLGNTTSNSKVEISPDNRWLLQHTSDLLQLWHLEGENIAENSQNIDSGNNLGKSAKFSPDSRWLYLSGRNGEPDRLFDLRSNDLMASEQKLYGTRENQGQTAVDFSRDGRWLALKTSPKEIQLYEFAGEGPELRCLLSGIALNGIGEFHGAIGFSPNSKFLATGSHNTGIRLWDIAAIDQVEMQSAPFQMAENEYRSVPQWQASDTGEQHTQLLTSTQGHTTHVIQFTSDARWVDTRVVGSGIRHTLWDLRKQQNQQTFLQRPGGTPAVKFSPRNDLLAVGCLDGKAKLYRFHDGMPQAVPITLDCGHSGHVLVNFSRDGRFLITSAGNENGGIQVWSLDNLADPTYRLTGISNPVRFSRISPTGRYVVADLDDGSPNPLGDGNPNLPIIYCWDLESERMDEPKKLEAHSAILRLMEFGDDDAEFFSGGDDGTLVRWDLSHDRPKGEVVLDTEKILKTPEVIWGLSRMPQGWRVASNQGMTGHLWDLKEDYSVRNSTQYQASPPHVSLSRSQKISSDGRWVADRAVWDSDNQSRVTAHHGVWAAAFSPTNLFFASRGHSALAPLIVSYLPEGATMRLRNLYGRVFPNSLDFSPDGRWLAVGYHLHERGTGAICLWEMDVDSAVRRGKRLVGRELTDAQRAEFDIPEL